MKAIGQYLVISEIAEATRTTAGGLEFTDRQLDDIRYVKGKVRTPGTDVSAVSPDDTILYDRHAGHGIEIDSEFFLVIREQDIVAVL